MRFFVTRDPTGEMRGRWIAARERIRPKIPANEEIDLKIV